MADQKEIKKVVLAYSGGLDTSIIIPWLKENYNDPEIIAVSGDVGQGTELDGLEEKAIKTGASKLYVEDLTDEMVDDVIIPSMMMGAKYEDYPAGHRLCPAHHRQAPGGDRQGRGGRRHLPRLYRQGQRPGPVRAGHQAFCSRDEDHRPLAGAGTSRAGTRRSTTPRPTTCP